MQRRALRQQEASDKCANETSLCRIGKYRRSERYAFRLSE